MVALGHALPRDPNTIPVESTTANQQRYTLEAMSLPLSMLTMWVEPSLVLQPLHEDETMSRISLIEIYKDNHPARVRAMSLLLLSFFMTIYA